MTGQPEAPAISGTRPNIATPSSRPALSGTTMRDRRRTSVSRNPAAAPETPTAVAKSEPAMAENGNKCLPGGRQTRGRVCGVPIIAAALCQNKSEGRQNVSWTADGYWLTRTVFERGLAFVYLIAFLNAVNQFKPLLGEHGLLPVPNWVKSVPFRQAPSLFYLAPSDGAFTLAAWAGVALSAAALAGFSEAFATWVSALAWLLLWVLYLSFVNVGQTFYAFGWEPILLEAGFYAIFLGSRATAPQSVTILLLRWLCFRIMFGAGLIKLRGDPCWQDVTCLDYHYETQPMPNPLSWYLHRAPHWTHQAGVWVNHFAELIVPFGYFLPQPIASIAGVTTILFQFLIASSGNLSWLNLLTMVLAVPALDDRVLAGLLPVSPPALQAPSPVHRAVVAAVVLMVLWLSIRPIRNMLSRRQVMNTAYNPLHLVGTYGAFGSITRNAL